MGNGSLLLSRHSAAPFFAILPAKPMLGIRRAAVRSAVPLKRESSGHAAMHLLFNSNSRMSCCWRRRRRKRKNILNLMMCRIEDSETRSPPQPVQQLRWLLRRLAAASGAGPLAPQRPVPHPELGPVPWPWPWPCSQLGAQQLPPLRPTQHQCGEQPEPRKALASKTAWSGNACSSIGAAKW